MLPGGRLLSPQPQLAAIMLLGELVRSVSGWVRTAQAELVQDHITNLIHQKSASADLAFYDSPDFYDHLHRARADASYRPVALLESLGNLSQNGITLAAMFAVLVPYGVWLAARSSCEHAARRLCRAALRVVASISGDCVPPPMSAAPGITIGCSPPERAAPELRLFGLGGFFQSAYQTLRAGFGMSVSRLPKSRASPNSRPVASRSWSQGPHCSGWFGRRFVGCLLSVTWRSSIRPSSKGSASRGPCWRMWASFMPTLSSSGICSNSWRLNPK